MRAFVVALATLVIAGVGQPAPAAGTSPVNGLWTGAIEVAGAQIPFRLDLEVGPDGAARAHFFDGARTTNPSTDGSLKEGKLHLSFPSYAGVIDATLSDGQLEGSYATNTRTLKFHANRAPPVTPAAGAAPPIGGEWFIPLQSDKGEHAWRLIVHQSGGRAEAAILRIDGDTGTLDGVWGDVAYVVAQEAAGGVKVDPDRALFWEVFGSLRWGVMCCGMPPIFRTVDPSVERAVIARRTSETEIDLLRLIAA